MGTYLPINPDLRLCIHHVGGRSGSRGFPVLKPFEADVVNVLYDADPDCLDQVQSYNSKYSSELHVLPFCLGEACRQTAFHITYDPYCSSVFEPNPQYAGYSSYSTDFDYPLGESIRVMEKRTASMVTMDHILENGIANVPPPDFLSIDTQGSELAILSGARQTLMANALAVSVEAEFHPIYRGQPLFGDLTRAFDELGFDFVQFESFGDMAPFRGPIGFRGRGYTLYSDALFFRRVSDLQRGETDSVRLAARLRKMAYIAIVYDQLELARECLIRSGGLLPNSHSRNRVYLQFLDELERALDQMPVLYPPTFSQKYTYEQSKARFYSEDKCRQMGISVPAFGQAKIEVSEPLDMRGYLEVENVLVRYGFTRQAKIVRENREKQLKLAPLPGAASHLGAVPSGNESSSKDLLEKYKQWTRDMGAAAFLRRNGIRSASVFGANSFASVLISDLSANGISVRCVLGDRRQFADGRFSGIPVAESPSVHELGDALLIPVFDDLRPSVKATLQTQWAGRPIVTLKDIVNGTYALSLAGNAR